MERAEATASPAPRAIAARPARRAGDGVLALLLLGPAALWSLCFFVLPLAKMAWRSVYRDGLTLLYYEKFFAGETYLNVILKTFQMSAIVTVGCLLLGYPVAYLLTMMSPRKRALLLLLVIVPYWLDFIVRSYSWMILLGRNGLINQALRGMELTASPIEFLYSVFSVSIGMIQILLPMMILTLFGAMVRIDDRLLLAASIHGARQFAVFRHVFFPLSLPGVFAGCLLVFVTSIGFYITPALLGGPKQTMISQSILVLAADLLDWPMASAVAIVLLMLSMVIVAVYSRFFSTERLWGGTDS